jgi:hypothetical protein
LDVQSNLHNAFQPEDVDVLATLADQVTIAIQNAQTFDATRQNLEEARRSSSAYLQDSWRTMGTKSSLWGYTITGNIVKPLEKPLQTALITDASVNGAPAYQSGARAGSLCRPAGWKCEALCTSIP